MKRTIENAGYIYIASAISHSSFSRPLSFCPEQKKTVLKRAKYRADSFYDENCCDIIYKTVVTSIDPRKKCVYLNTGEKLRSEKSTLMAFFIDRRHELLGGAV